MGSDGVAIDGNGRFALERGQERPVFSFSKNVSAGKSLNRLTFQPWRQAFGHFPKPLVFGTTLNFL
jgi:hypothetical protein